MRSIKIIWDFRGEDGEQTAKHHAIHLREFCEREKIAYSEIDVESLSDMHTIAFVSVLESEVVAIRDALKPHRALVAD